MYQPIDQQRTGQKLKNMFKLAGYDVKYIQEYLNLSCPQPIYRWFKGQNLPTVEKLYALSILLGVHMEELLVLQGQSMNIGLYKVAQEPKDKRLLYYAQHLQGGSISVLDYPSNDKDLTLRYPFIRTFEWVPVRGYFY